MRVFGLFVAGVLLIGVFPAGSARANIEPPSTIDARAAALAGTGVAYIHNGSSVFHNPAGLHGIGDFSVTLALSPSIATLTAPVNGPGTEFDSEASVFPMFLAGGAYRVSDKIVAGFAIYPTGGFGGKYKDVDVLGGEDLDLEAAILEFSPAVSYAIEDDLVVGIGYRVTYMQLTSHQPVPDPQLPPGTFADIDTSGINLAGLHLGVSLHPLPELEIGLAYRSKVTTTMTGDTTLLGMDSDTSIDFSTPHGYRLGGAYSMLDNKLMLTAEMRFLAYSESNKQLVTTVTQPDGQKVASAVPLDWDDSFSFGFAGEYEVGPRVRVRGGYRLSMSATPEETAGIFVVPPGVAHSLHAGAGIGSSEWDVDIGAYYMLSRATDITPRPPSSPGTYDGRFMVFALSATYRR